MRRLLNSVIALSIAGASLAAQPPDRFDGYFGSLAASGYRSCGRVLIDGTNRSMVDACVLKAFGESAPFFARYDRQGVDSNVAFGLLFSKAKVLTVVLFDDYSCPTPYCARPQSCYSPQITKTKTGIHVECRNHYDL